MFGYLIIEIDAENGEHILNKAQAEKIHIWNLKCKRGKITGNIGIKDFIKLRAIKRGIKCKIKILNKKGVIFYTNKYKNRLGILFGVVLFFVILSILSNFVWIINVEGNKSIGYNDIIKSCKKIGIHEGIPKSKINNKYDAQRLQLIQEGVSWCSLNVEGSVLTVNLSEKAVTDKEKRKSPSNLKASLDGKIKKINISSGASVVKVGDIVARGDLLVSGINQNLSSSVFVYSEGKIIAETKRTFSAEGEYVQKVEENTDKCINRYSIELFNLKLPLYFGNIKAKNLYSCDVKNLKLFGKKIPIKTATEHFEILKQKTVKYDSSALEKLLLDDIEMQVEKIDFISINETSKEVITTDKGMLLKIEYLCEENIAVQDKILLHTEN